MGKPKKASALSNSSKIGKLSTNNSNMEITTNFC